MAPGPGRQAQADTQTKGKAPRHGRGSAEPRDPRRSSYFACSARTAKAPDSVKNLPSSGPQLLMAIPKRLLKRAVDRNAVRRVAREAWRTQSGDTRANGRSVLLRLISRPKNLTELSRPQRKKLWRRELDLVFASLLAGLAGKKNNPMATVNPPDKTV